MAFDFEAACLLVKPLKTQLIYVSLEVNLRPQKFRMLQIFFKKY